MSRYKLVTKSWLVVREVGEPSPRLLDNPEAVARPARNLIRDDDREHFWVVFVNTKNHFQGTHEVSTGILSATSSSGAGQSGGCRWPSVAH